MRLLVLLKFGRMSFTQIKTINDLIRNVAAKSECQGDSQNDHDAAETRHRKVNRRAFLYVALWLLWLLGGTLFYSFAPGNNHDLFVGFYQAVNIGYSIGYGFPREPHRQNWWFSSLYVVLGASLVGAALGYFADKIVETRENWFTELLRREEFEDDLQRDKPFFTRFKAFVKYNWGSLRAILLWFVWIAIMIMYSMVEVKWPFSQAQYFAVSTCSTGGHMPIPDDSPHWLFGVTGFFAAIGVPLMGTAMASAASMLMEGQGDINDMKETIEEEVTPEELLMLKEYGLEDGDGEIDKAEFIIMCMVRTGTDPRLIQFISEHFKKLDADQSGALDIEEITKGRHSHADLQELERSEKYKELRRNSRSISNLSSLVEESKTGI